MTVVMISLMYLFCRGTKSKSLDQATDFVKFNFIKTFIKTTTKDWCMHDLLVRRNECVNFNIHFCSSSRQTELVNCEISCPWFWCVLRFIKLENLVFILKYFIYAWQGNWIYTRNKRRSLCKICVIN